MTSQVAKDGSVHAPNCSDPDACAIFQCGDRVQRAQATGQEVHQTLADVEVSKPRCQRFTASTSSCLRPVVPGTTRCATHPEDRVPDTCSTCHKPIGIICPDTSIHLHHEAFVLGVNYPSQRQHCPGRPDQSENR